MNHSATQKLNSKLHIKIFKHIFRSITKFKSSPDSSLQQKKMKLLHWVEAVRDYTASIFGRMDAEEIEIWTDVDGILTADPRKVADAFSLPALLLMKKQWKCRTSVQKLFIRQL